MAAGKFGYGQPKVQKPKKPNRVGRVMDWSPTARKRRKLRQERRQFNEAPYGQNTLTGRDAVQEARRAAGYKYGSAQRDLRQELGTVPGQHRAIDLAFNIYGQ